MNPAFKRFRLVVVEDEQLQRLHRDRMKQIRDYNPELLSQALKQSSLALILDNPQLSAEEKLRHLRIAHRSLKPVERSVISTPDPKNRVKVVFRQPGFRTEIPVLGPIPLAVPPPPPQQQQQQQAIPDGGEQAQVAFQPHMRAEGGEQEEEADEDEEIFLDADAATTPAAAAAAAPSGVRTTATAAPDLLFDHVIQAMPAAARQKAADLARIISDNPQLIGLNPNSEFVIDGERIPHSNALNMFKHMYNPRHASEPPTGYAKILNSLARLKVPLNLISNKHIQSFLKDAYQTGHGGKSAAKRKRTFAFPPAARPSTHITFHSKPKAPIGFAKFPKKPDSKRARNHSSHSALNLFKVF